MDTNGLAVSFLAKAQTATSEQAVVGDLNPPSYPTINAHLPQPMSAAEKKWAATYNSDLDKLIHEITEQLDVQHKTVATTVDSLRSNIGTAMKQMDTDGLAVSFLAKAQTATSEQAVVGDLNPPSYPTIRGCGRGSESSHIPNHQCAPASADVCR
eukprot:TRINITY_DN7060_c0_g1_i2.p1 TRINITY_DN7060_c0_g1~~TRINITY_DN7060_c0_g1_i2.p1  ORF type:complete len:155 (+),score=27.42 TRINITY_DN7060_c0_g1_i2:167-631(+)